MLVLPSALAHNNRTLERLTAHASNPLGRAEGISRTLGFLSSVHAFSGAFKEVVHVPVHVACGFHKLLEDLHIIAHSYAVYAPPHKDCVFGTCAGFRADVDSEVLCKVFP